MWSLRSSRLIKGEDRHQATLFPENLDDYIAEDSPVQAIDVFVDELDPSGMGFKTQPEATGRPGYHPATLLTLFTYGYLTRVQWSRRLERKAQRSVELMWLTGRLALAFKTIADFALKTAAHSRLELRRSSSSSQSTRPSRSRSNSWNSCSRTPCRPGPRRARMRWQN